MQVKHTLQKTLKDGDVLRNYEVIFIGSYIYEPLNLTCARNGTFSLSFRYPSVILPLSFRYAGKMKVD